MLLRSVQEPAALFCFHLDVPEATLSCQQAPDPMGEFSSLVLPPVIEILPRGSQRPEHRAVVQLIDLFVEHGLLLGCS